MSVRGKVKFSFNTPLLPWTGAVAGKGENKQKKKINGRMKMNRIQMKEDGTLGYSRKTSMVVK